MTLLNIYLKSDLELDPLADELRIIFNCNTRNQSKWQVDQKRYGLNFGGNYYLFEVMGLGLHLVKNEGEVFEETFSDYEYYIYCQELEIVDHELFKQFVSYIGQLLHKKGIPNRVIES